MLDDFSVIIFDLDGTLIDSMSVWEDIDIRWLTAYGISPTKDLLKRFKSMDFDEAAFYTIHDLHIDETPEALKAMWTDMVYEAYAHDISLKDGAAALLSSLKAKNKRLFLATSCEERCCRAVLSHTGIFDYFEKIFYTQAFGQSKAHPAVFEACAAYAGVDPKACVVLDDIYPALLGAHKAGMAFIGVYDAVSAVDWPTMQREAKCCITNLKELL